LPSSQGPSRAKPGLCFMHVIALSLLLTLTVFIPSSWGQAKVRVNWTAISGAQSGLWLAYEGCGESSPFVRYGGDDEEEKNSHHMA